MRCYYALDSYVLLRAGVDWMALAIQFISCMIAVTALAAFLVTEFVSCVNCAACCSRGMRAAGAAHNRYSKATLRKVTYREICNKEEEFVVGINHLASYSKHTYYTVGSRSRGSPPTV